MLEICSHLRTYASAKQAPLNGQYDADLMTMASPGKLSLVAVPFVASARRHEIMGIHLLKKARARVHILWSISAILALINFQSDTVQCLLLIICLKSTKSEYISPKYTPARSQSSSTTMEIAPQIDPQVFGRF